VETLGAARLAKEIPAQRAVAAIVPRDEITAALEDPETSPELVLRVTDEGPEESVISMTWSRDELARLLEEAKGDNVVLTFDREELSEAIGDVEAHGLRERALVFAVAAAGALGTGAGIANAMPTNDDGSGGVVATSVSPTVSSADALTDVSSAGGYTAASADAATAAVGNTVSDAASGSGYAPSTDAGSTISDAASGAGYAPSTDAAGPASATMTDVSSSGGYGAVEATSSSGEFLGIDQSALTDGLIAGGILLTIAGATFVARRTEMPRPA